ncbi:phosphatase PAP2 family protein [Pontibacter actiniarum]|uniref:Phosphatidic acid phosphatase type 2/haloperoxidase domain-containing protein n=1 Tax=Pontibacter actiniarum TaxID=323450 RepID=A0A1X9YXC6_9BACT|nr:phosphatase PAP2 family protein [Pontibacter actiniarum]ARS37565.1 hypothetical protein CA264_20225 [Pontibacter actiniarum]
MSAYLATPKFLMRGAWLSFLILLLSPRTHLQGQDTMVVPHTGYQAQYTLPDNVITEDSHQTTYLRNTLYVTGTAALWTAAFVLTDEPLQQYAQRYRGKVSNSFAQVVEPLGRQRYWVPAAGAVFVGGLLAKDQKLRKVALISFGSVVVNATLTSALKNAIGRYRPSETSENEVFDASLNPFIHNPHSSLPSSHTSTAFAVATSVATVYADHKLIPPIAYGVATLVGLSRIHDNAHWGSDVLAGAAVGYLSSKGVSYLYDWADHRLRARKQRLVLTPQVSPGTAGLGATLIF